MYDGIFLLVIGAISSLALVFLIGGSGLLFIGSPILRRDRTRPIRMRKYPAWEGWLATHYPKATNAEAEVIRRVVQAIARDARVEPTQLLPSDPLSGFVLPTSWECFISLDGESEYSLAMEELLQEGDVPPEDWALRSDEPNETVGDAIGCILRRACASSSQSGPT